MELFDVLYYKFTKVQDVPIISTSDVAPDTVATLDFTLPEDGVYFIGYSFQADFNGTKDKLLYFREVRDTTILSEWFSSAAPAIAGNHRNRFYAYPKQLTAGVHKLELQMYKDAVISDMDIDFVDLFIMRVL